MIDETKDISYDLPGLLKKIERLQTLVNDSEKSNLERQGKIEELEKQLKDEVIRSKGLRQEARNAYGDMNKAQSDKEEVFLLVRQYKAMYDALFDKIYGIGDDE